VVVDRRWVSFFSLALWAWPRLSPRPAAIPFFLPLACGVWARVSLSGDLLGAPSNTTTWLLSSVLSVNKRRMETELVTNT